MEDGNGISSNSQGGSQAFNSQIFEQLWHSLDSTEVTTSDFQYHVENDDGLFNEREIQLQIDDVQIPHLPTGFSQPPQTFGPSIDSGAPPDDLTSEMTTSPGAVSVQSPAPPNGPVQNGAASQALPSNTVWPGEHEFDFSLETCGEHAEKSISWTYSTALKKLFVDKEKECPVNFRTTTQPPQGTVVRVMMIFIKAANMQEVVKRCPHHMGTDADPSKHHVVVCRDPATRYETDPDTGRHSLVLPYNEPQPGTSSLQYLFSFKCFMSCVGGLNRRPIQLIFTLEHMGKIIGRQCLDTRICACPGRDRKADEKKAGKPKKTTKRTKQVTQVAITTLKKRKTNDFKDQEVFDIRVVGREKYEILMKMKEALDLMDFSTSEQREASRARNEQIAKLPQSMVSNLSGSSQSSQGSTVIPVQLQSPPPQQVVQPGTSLPQMMPSQPAQPQSIPPTHMMSPSAHHPELSDLLGHGMMSTQSFDASSINLPLSSQHSYTQLQTIPSLSRGDTLPVLSMSPSLQQYLITDQPDGGGGVGLAEAMDVGSSRHQQHSPPVVNNSSVSPTASENHVSSSVDMADKSIDRWLGSIGYGKHSSKFQERGYHTVDCLEEINLEFFNEANIPPHEREAIWKHILAFRQERDRLKCTPPLQRIRSDTSTISNASQICSGSQGGPMMRATRFTLKQTLSYKVKEEDVGEDET